MVFRFIIIFFSGKFPAVINPLNLWFSAVIHHHKTTMGLHCGEYTDGTSSSVSKISNIFNNVPGGTNTCRSWLAWAQLVPKQCTPVWVLSCESQQGAGCEWVWTLLPFQFIVLLLLPGGKEQLRVLYYGRASLSKMREQRDKGRNVYFTRGSRRN